MPGKVLSMARNPGKSHVDRFEREHGHPFVPIDEPSEKWCAGCAERAWAKEKRELLEFCKRMKKELDQVLKGIEEKGG